MRRRFRPSEGLASSWAEFDLTVTLPSIAREARHSTTRLDEFNYESQAATAGYLDGIAAISISATISTSLSARQPTMLIPSLVGTDSALFSQLGIAADVIVALGCPGEIQDSLTHRCGGPFSWCLSLLS